MQSIKRYKYNLVIKYSYIGGIFHLLKFLDVNWRGNVELMYQNKSNVTSMASKPWITLREGLGNT